MRRGLAHQRAGRLAAVLALAAVTGCASSLFRGDDAEQTLEEVAESGTPLISRYAHPLGLHPLKVEAVALVTGLDGTGEDPPPTPQRAALLDEMNRHNVDKPNAVLLSPDTALVLVQGWLGPGIQKGDRFDIEVRTPTRSETTSLRGGSVLPARLTELAVLGGQIRKGELLAIAKGPILVDPSSGEDDSVAHATRGRILGGGVCLKDRPLGLVIASNHRSVRMAKSIADAINLRFHRYDGGRKVGVATAKTDERIELQLHPRYKDNITRFVRVVRSLPLRETPAARQERIRLLEQQLLDPLTASTAALRLEAIGDETAIEKLMVGAGASDPEVRFYASEALAYLDQTEGVHALAQAARNEPAFRVHALAALSAMDDVVAYDSLRSLLDSQSAETRYGAFRALWAMNKSDPLIRGENLGEGFGYHVLDVEGPPMVHATRSDRPELVLFGKNQPLELPMVLDAGNDILVNGLVGDEVTVSRFGSGEGRDQKRVVSPDVDSVVRAIVELGGAYPDVVQALQQAKRDGALASRFRVDAIPLAGREYDRDEDTDSGDESEGEPVSEPGYHVATPMPDLFSKKR